MTNDELLALRQRAFRNHDAVLAASTCGCFTCCALFPSSSIAAFVGESQPSAVCPLCETDTVVPSSSEAPLTAEVLTQLHHLHYGPDYPGRPAPLWKRALEVLVGLLAVPIAALTYWTVWMFLTAPPEESSAASPATLYSICFLLTFIASAATLFGLRLIFPRLRTRHGSIIGRQGLLAFFLLYGLLVTLSLWNGSVRAKALVLTVALVTLSRYAWRSTFPPKPPGSGDVAV